MFNPTRDQARQFLFDTWRKTHSRRIAHATEDLTAQLINKHPEYHELLAAPEQQSGQGLCAGRTAVNPFLHIMMHSPLKSSFHRPAARHPRAVCATTHKYESEHEAQHAMMDFWAR